MIRTFSALTCLSLLVQPLPSSIPGENITGSNDVSVTIIEMKDRPSNVSSGSKLLKNGAIIGGALIGGYLAAAAAGELVSRLDPADRDQNQRNDRNNDVATTRKKLYQRIPHSEDAIRSLAGDSYIDQLDFIKHSSADSLRKGFYGEENSRIAALVNHFFSPDEEEFFLNTDLEYPGVAINPNQHPSHYVDFGRLLAVVLIQKTFTKQKLIITEKLENGILWELLGHQLNAQNFVEADAKAFSQLRKRIANIESLGLAYYDANGRMVYEFEAGGRSLDLRSDDKYNADLYMNAYIESYYRVRIKPQLNGLKRGFYEILPLHTFEDFHASEIVELLYRK